ncbi:hypothetical protein F4808DRAFT_460843 [Astrocystis sublimbata]|nr:hypothetical protein F4808DRAFT_460843 [Astrocystis sublimbata]
MGLATIAAKATKVSLLKCSQVCEASTAALTGVWRIMGRRWRFMIGIIVVLLSLTVVLTQTNLDRRVPRLRFEYAHESSPTEPEVATIPTSFKPQDSPFNQSKVALLIENRPQPLLAPLLLHFIAVVPPDWRFRFMGSDESVAAVNKSQAVRAQVASGKLDLTLIPANMSTMGQEAISQFLTTLWLYETVLQPAEWLLVFQTDSILCANSRQNLNDYLDYDWVGAPWNPSGRFGGNGGLSMRRVSAIIEVLRDQVRADNSEAEDVWLTERLGHRPGARMANGSLSLTFSGEINPGDPSSPAADDEGYYLKGSDDLREGFYEPMGYHTGGGGAFLHGKVWGEPRLRKHIWDYCPEVKMTLAMDAAKFVPGDCGAQWPRKRDESGPANIGSLSLEDVGYGTELIDGHEYPKLPPNLVPW